MNGQMPRLLLLVGLIVYGFLSARSLLKNDQLDFYVYRMGAKFALAGESPYNTPLMEAEVAKAFPPENENSFANNCGFFLAPQTIALFAPFAMLDWDIAQILWFLVLTGCALACGTLAFTFGRDQTQRGNGWAVIILVVLLNPITQPSLVVGQTTLLLVGSIALGQLCFERGRPTLGCLLWAIPFIKPHLAILFLVLAMVLGGWKRAAGIALFAGILNLLGGWVLRGNLLGAVLLPREYLEYLGSGHKAVVFNLVEQNYQILSWNRMVAALGGPAINLRVSMTLGGYALWIVLLACRLRRRDNLNLAYLLACTAVGTLFFAQVLAYEMLLLALLAPLIAQLFDADCRGDFWTLIGLLVFLLIPLNVMDQVANALQLGDDSHGRILLRSHKCFGMAALALYLLIRAPAACGVAKTTAMPQAA